MQACVRAKKCSSSTSRRVRTTRSGRSGRCSRSAIVRMSTAGFGVSVSDVTADAVKEAVRDAKVGLGSEVSCAIVSATVTRDLEEVRTAFVDALPTGTPIHGLTSSASILTTSGQKAGAVGCLLLTHSDLATSFSTDDAAAAVAQLKEKMTDPQAIFMSTTPGAEESVLASIKDAYGSVPVWGGTAADDALLGEWKVMSADSSSSTGVSLIGIGKGVKMGASMLGPYTATAKTCVATRAEGRRVFEIDNKSAKDWVLGWLGDAVKKEYEEGGLILPQTAQRPIGMKMPAGEFVTAHLAALGGGEEQYVDFFAPVAEGTTLYVMDAADGPNTGYSSALLRAYSAAKEDLDSDVKAGILVFCGGMAIAVGDKLDQGLTSEWSDQLQGVPVMGMTCFGEQAFLSDEKESVQRNLSVGMVLFG